jgi:aminoglycoside phosphotransferase (APT) family kinase protein
LNNDLLPALEHYYRQAFPQREGVQLAELNHLNNGWESDAYTFTVEWGQQGVRQHEKLVLRIYPSADAVDKSAREYYALKNLYQAGYPVPRVDLLEQARSPFEKPFLIMEYIDGCNMWEPMFHDPSPHERQRLLEIFCGLFARLHTLDWHIFTNQFGGYSQQDSNSTIESQLDRWKPYIEAAPIPGFLPGWEWLMSNYQGITDAAPSLVHWDFHPNNIMLRKPGSKGEEAVVIDWAGLEIADYRFDLAWTLLLLTSNEGQQWREPILREYERQSGRAVTDLEFFESAACFRRLYSIMASFSYGADKIGMRPGAEAQMRSQAAHIGRVYERSLALNGITIPEVARFLEEVWT